MKLVRSSRGFQGTRAVALGPYRVIVSRALYSSTAGLHCQACQVEPKNVRRVQQRLLVTGGKEKQVRDLTGGATPPANLSRVKP